MYLVLNVLYLILVFLTNYVLSTEVNFIPKYNFYILFFSQMCNYENFQTYRENKRITQ